MNQDENVIFLIIIIKRMTSLEGGCIFLVGSREPSYTRSLIWVLHISLLRSKRVDQYLKMELV